VEILARKRLCPKWKGGPKMCRRILVLPSLILFLAAFLFRAGPLLADEILLENGDRLTGTVLKVEGGKLTLKTDYAGEIQVPVEKIKKLSTRQPSEVHLNDGEVLKGKLKDGRRG
jgi:hypothetical protein